MSDLTINSDNLAALSLDDLAFRFESIERQGQLMQGLILLEARNRFKSDNEFGAWIEKTGGAIYSTCRQHRTKLMNLARFFEKRSIEKISISAAYEISAPINADIAVDVYEYAKNKNLPLSEIRKQIAIRKGESLPIPENEPVPIIPTNNVLITGHSIEYEPVTEQKQDVTPEKSKLDLIFQILDGLNVGEKLKLLRECLTIVNSSMRPK